MNLAKHVSGKFQSHNRRRINESGLITLDFMFALMLSIGFAVIFFSVAITLSLVETAQYVTFATSRAYLGANETEQAQQDLANSKYKEIMGNRAFQTFLGQNWMKLGQPELGDFSGDYPVDPETDSNTFVGARIAIDAELLRLRVPFLGPTFEDSNVGRATLNSYLMREVSTTECREQFNRPRFENLQALGYTIPAGGEAKLITDNGC